MHPIEFVTTLIEAGKKHDLIVMIQAKISELSEMKKSAPEHKDAYLFAILFLISVLRQLDALPADTPFEHDNLLSVWRELGLFGIDRDAISDWVETTREHHE